MRGPTPLRRFDPRAWRRRGLLAWAGVLIGCAAEDDPCARPGSFVGRWQAEVREAHAAGTYTLTLKGSSAAAETGSHALTREVTYDADAPQFAGCHETGRFAGTWGVDVGGAFWIVLLPLSGERSGCAAASQDRPTFPGNTTMPDKTRLEGAAAVTACTLTIDETAFVEAPAPVTADGI